MKIKVKKNAVIFCRTDEETKQQFLDKIAEFGQNQNDAVEELIKKFNKKKLSGLIR